MRPLEIIIPLLLGLYLLWPHPRPFFTRLIPALGSILTLIHLGVEGYRWQMIPLYTLTVLLTISNLARIHSAKDWPGYVSFLTVALLLICTALPIVLPVPKIPSPSGPYPIGTAIYEMTDHSRQELYSDQAGPRRFMIQVWYPAEIGADDVRAPWMANADIFAPAIADFIRMPSYFLDHLTLVDIPAYQNAKLATAQKSFPIILFSHGWRGFNAQNSGQALELASHGYVVVAIQHTYGAITTVFQGGIIAPNNPYALPEDEDDPNYEVVARKLVDQWAGDISFVLDQLNSAGKDPGNEAGDFFNSSLDFSRIGVYGHSTGGGAAIQFCGTDPRCKAVLGMDPFMRPVSAEVIENGLSQPSFFMFSQIWADDLDSKNNRLFNQFHQNLINNAGVINITGTKHYDFSDLPLLSPIAPQLGLKGPLNGKHVTGIVNSYLLGFFEMTLNDGSSSLFNSDFTDYPEVRKIK
jgi:predicted dienelactone hydrolase